jgi:transcriptional regulator GlxA family with amidase domain
VLAESGAIDGKSATAHWGDIDRLERVYPRVNWQRGVRYVEGGNLLSTAGLTAGVDATLHLLARRNGVERAAKVAQTLRIPHLHLLRIRSAGNLNSVWPTRSSC